ncbi:MAG: dihydroxy-acid dehydratase, partial [Actinobacteria bacterium]|nr:dihydroxy-acid dehydratase [Actinomycetota bacterium]
TIEEYNKASEDENLDVTPESIIVVKNAGPKGYPGFPEVGNVSLPRKILAQGITDMIRISDARMSGTGFGTVILHVSPEAAVGGPLGLVQTGDEIELDVANRTLTLHVSDEELAKRRALWKSPVKAVARGWAKIYTEHVMQAHEGADLDFLRGNSGNEVGRNSH